MKIGIVTLRFHANYGGLLQAWALQTVLKRMGHEAVFIQREWKVLRKPTLKKLKVYLNNFKMCITGKRLFPNIFRDDEANEFKLICSNTDCFVRKYLHCIIVNHFKQVKHDGFDALLVGSDQVWRPNFFNAKISEAYFKFAERWNNIKRIAYAPSFGTDVWEYSPEQTAECIKLIKKFDAVSVREYNGVDLCRKHLGVKAIQMPDPTLLLEKEDYMNLIPNRNNNHLGKLLMCYILDDNEEKYKIVKYIADMRGLTPFFTNSKYESKMPSPLSERIQPPVENWLEAFNKSEFVVTDSFHACIFAILFKKPFVVIGNTHRGIDRITSLLSDFNLENRLVMSASENIPFNDIDYECINKRLSEIRGKAFDFLCKSLT